MAVRKILIRAVSFHLIKEFLWSNKAKIFFTMFVARKFKNTEHHISMSSMHVSRHEEVNYIPQAFLSLAPHQLLYTDIHR